MRKLYSIVKENWNDPVWSNVIATGIVAIAGSVLTAIYAIFKFFISNISIQESLKKIIDFINKPISVKLWVILIFLIVYLILVPKPFLRLLRNIASIFTFSQKHSKKHCKVELPKASEHSTSLFYQRMSSAFPGIRDVTWFNNSKIATKRLEILLAEPLRFKSEIRDCESDPIWWFRGTSALFINKFKRLNSNVVLMNIDQLKIKRIAAFHGRTYYQDFVYVEVEGEKQTGLYKLSPESIQKQIDYFGYSWEEYGILNGLFGWKYFIRREDYDDGATVVRGKVVDASKAEIRVRYLSKYNFIIAAKGSPYNSDKFNRESQSYFDGILTNKIDPTDFFHFLKGFNKKEF